MITSRLLAMEDSGRKEWEELFSASEVKDVFLSWEWLFLEKNSNGMGVKLLVLSDGGKAVGGTALLEKKYFGKTVTHSKGGPLFIKGHDLVKTKILECFSGRGPLSLDYVLFRPDQKPDAEALRGRGFTESGKSTFIVGLKRFGGDAGKLLSSLPKETRYEIRKAEKSGLEFTEAEGEGDWMEFAGLHREHAGAKGFSPQKDSFFTDLRESMMPKKLARLYVAKHEGKIVAGTLALFSRGQRGYAVYYIGASMQEYNRHSPLYMLLWMAMSDAVKDGADLFDLGGAGDYLRTHDEKHKGPYEFKSKWGGDYVEYSVYSPGKAHAVVRKIAKKYPSVHKVFFRMRSSK